MRVVSGILGGRVSKGNLPSGIRPTTNRVKESLFSSLENIADFDGITVYDFFSGSGSLWIESISRGAAKAVSIDKNRKALEYQKSVAESFRIRDSVQFIAGDALKTLEKLAIQDEGALIFADPPYNYGLAQKFLNACKKLNNLTIVLEHSPREHLDSDGFEILFERDYGDSILTVLTLDS